MNALAAADAFLDSAARLYRLDAGGALAGLQVEAYVLEEALSQPWRLEISLLHPRADLDLEPMLACQATLVTVLGDGREHRRTGQVAQAAAEGSDGGLARYRLTLQPWLGFLALSVRSVPWQDKAVSAIVDSVLSRHAGLGSWRWSPCALQLLTEGPEGGVRRYCVQYRESDLDFIARILAEEGIGYRFEEAAAGRPGPTVVFFADSTAADSMPEDVSSANAAFGRGIRFHRDGADEAEDAVQAFGGVRGQPVAVLTAVGCDSPSDRLVGAEVPTLGSVGGEDALWLEAYDSPQASPAADEGGLERVLRIRQQAIEARHKRWIGRGSVRSFAAGTTFVLTESMLDLRLPPPAARPENRFLLTRVTQIGINNLPRETHDSWSATGRTSGGADVLPPWIDPQLRRQAAQRGCANEFEAIRASVPWRPLLTDDGGQRINPKPRVAGPLTATVVGPDGSHRPRGAEELHADRQGRVRIRYDFQDDEPGGAPASTWVRVLQPLAGDGTGSRWLPRIGHEVLVGFFDDDIDQPYIVCSLYNGRGDGGQPPTPGGRAAPASATEADAFAHSSDARPGGQGNLSGGSSPAWHGASPAATAQGGQANPGALSGYKTREFGGSGFNQLVFDDSRAQLRLQLATTQHASQLNLGHLIHQADNHRGSFRGLGFELRTDAYGAVRGGQGLLLSTYAIAAADPAGDNAAGIALAKQWQVLADAFHRATRSHQTVGFSGVIGTTRAGASRLDDRAAPIAAWLRQASGMVAATGFEAAQADAAARSTATDDGLLPHATDPVVSISARAGLALTAGQDVVLASGENLQLASGDNLDIAAGGALRLHTGQAIGVLGGAIQPGDAAVGTGLSLVAASGDIDLQAHDGTLQIAALGELSIRSQRAGIDWAAAKKITLSTAGGASLLIEGGNVTLMCPGSLTVRAGRKSFLGPDKVAQPMPTLPGQVCLACLLKARQTGSRIVLA